MICRRDRLLSVSRDRFSVFLAAHRSQCTRILVRRDRMENVWLTCPDRIGLDTGFSFYLFCSSFFLPGYGGFLFLEFRLGLEKRFRFCFHFDFDLRFFFPCMGWPYTFPWFPFPFPIYLLTVCSIHSLPYCPTVRIGIFILILIFILIPPVIVSILCSPLSSPSCVASW